MNQVFCFAHGVRLAIACVLVLGLHAQGAVAQSSGSDERNNTFEQLDLFGEVFERVRAQYVQDVTDQELIEAAINGMLTSLDPHSSYLDEETFADMQVQTRGSFGGLGIEVTMENGLVRVVSPIDDTPAFRAGLEAGDLITHLDAEPVLGMDLNDAVELMRGPVGSEIILTILRDDAEPFDVTIKRDVIRIESVRWRVEEEFGYIRISSFTGQTADGLERAIEGIDEQLGGGAKGYVIDLRNNPGGLLDQAVQVSDTFLDQGEIVSTRSRDPDASQRYNAEKGDLVDGKPLIVLINGGSASASEIVAGALQDHRRAVLIGTDTFGKGSVQTIMPLPGHGAMRLTTARYYTPSGRSIQALGISPDIEVQPARLEELSEGGRREGDLRDALSNDQVSSADDDAAPVEDEEAIDAAEASEDEEEATTPDLPFDYQLARALDLLRGVTLFNQQIVN
ncbi:MAG: S41 family peptidase [Pseudomonadota bacterium]